MKITREVCDECHWMCPPYVGLRVSVWVRVRAVAPERMHGPHRSICMYFMSPEGTPWCGAPLCANVPAPFYTGLQVYRLANGVLRRLGAFTVHNARRKQQLLDEWRVLQARRLTRGASPGVGAKQAWHLVCSEADTRCCYGALCVGGGLQRLDCLPLAPMAATVPTVHSRSSPG